MGNINKPMNIPELNLEPPGSGKMRLSEDMQQTLALLTGYGDNKRVVLKASDSGVLATASRRIADVVHYTGVGANDEQIGIDIACTEVMVVGHPDNTGLIWVRPDKVATVDNAWPLPANGAVGFSLSNLKQLNMLIVVAGEKVIVSYTR